MSRRKDADIAAEKAYLDALTAVSEKASELADLIPAVIKTRRELSITELQALGQVSVEISRALCPYADASLRVGHMQLTRIRTSPLNPITCRKSVVGGIRHEDVL